MNYLPEVVEFLYYQQGGWLSVLFGNDERQLCGNYAGVLRDVDGAGREVLAYRTREVDPTSRVPVRHAPACLPPSGASAKCVTCMAGAGGAAG